MYISQLINFLYPLNNIICWYKFKSSTNIIKSLTLTLRRTANAIVEVYLEKTNSRFSYKGDLTSSTLNINTENDQYAIWVLMMPKGTDASTSGFRVTPSEFVASSSSKKSNFVLIISVFSGAVGFIYFVVIFIVVIVILIKRYRNKRKQRFYGPESRSDQTKNNKTEELDKEEQLTIGEENKEDIRCSSPKDFDEKLKYIEKNQEWLKDLDANRDSCFELIGENKNTTADNTQSSLNSIKHFEVTVRNVWYENTSNTVVKSN